MAGVCGDGAVAARWYQIDSPCIPELAATVTRSVSRRWSEQLPGPLVLHVSQVIKFGCAEHLDILGAHPAVVDAEGPAPGKSSADSVRARLSWRAMPRTNPVVHEPTPNRRSVVSLRGGCTLNPRDRAALSDQIAAAAVYYYPST